MQTATWVIGRLMIGCFFVAVCGFNHSCVAQELKFEGERTVQAKSIASLHRTFSGITKVAHLGLGVTDDPEKLGDPMAQIIHTQNAYFAVSSDSNESVISALAIARSEYGKVGWLFWEPGEHYLRWGLSSGSGEPYHLKTVERVIVLPPSQPDLTFLSRVSAPVLLRRLFGRDNSEYRAEERLAWVLSPENTDERALIVIAELLQATQQREPGFAVRRRETEEEMRIWGEQMLELAKELPESSYAPYAAYYAGCCYMGASANRRKEATLAEMREVEDKSLDNVRAASARALVRLAHTDEDVGRALEAFELATERADDYLKPKALYQVGACRTIKGDFGGAGKAADLADAAFDGEGEIKAWTQGLRKQIDEFRKAVGAPDHADNRPAP